MKVFISGKISGLPPLRAEKIFKEAESWLRIEGFTPVNPAVMIQNPGLEHEEYMHITKAMLDVCDAIYMLDNWEDSKGANMELEYAREKGNTIMWEKEESN